MRAGETPLPVWRDAETAAHETCATCPSLCRSACPVAEAEGRETVAPRQLMLAAGLQAEGRLEPRAVGALPWACTGCGACEEVCLHDNEVPFWLLLARHRVKEAGAAPAVAIEAAASFGVAGNAFGVSLSPALDGLLRAAGARPTRAARDLYLPGCLTLHALPGVAAHLLRAARVGGLGELAVTPASEHCCGAPLAWSGELEGFAAHARRYANELEGARRVVVHEPLCAHTLRVLYPRVGVRLRPEILTLPAFLRESLRARPSDGTGPRYAFLEPCHLRRRLGEIEGPWGLLDDTLGARCVPLETREAGGDCCGAAGLLPETRPHTAWAMAEARIEAFRASGADRLLTASPRCAAHLLSVAPSLPVDDLGVLARVEETA